MVIKQTNKTKAKQRKQAIINWKLMGRKVIVMVKDLGSEHAKFLLHSHDRFIEEATKDVMVFGSTGGGGSSLVPIPRSNRSYSNATSHLDGSSGHVGEEVIGDHIEPHDVQRLRRVSNYTNQL